MQGHQHDKSATPMDNVKKHAAVVAWTRAWAQDLKKERGPAGFNTAGIIAICWSYLVAMQDGGL